MSLVKTTKFQLWGILSMLILWSSCRKDFDYQASTGQLSFSKDTIYLDTVFSTIGSSTYSLKVYNRSHTDIQIPSIALKNGVDSKYRINVDGQSGMEFFNTPLLAKDSLYIFIEVTYSISFTDEKDFLYTDALLFDSGTNQQSVPLITLIKDAIFLYPKKDAKGLSQTISLDIGTDGSTLTTNGFFLDENQLNFSNEKPYVIYGYAAIPKTKTLTITAGAHIYFHQNSGILVTANSSLRINGSPSSDPIALENEVIFEGDRLEPGLGTIPGQWGTIWFDKESSDNHINHLTVKNATIGLFVHGNNAENVTNLYIDNSQIHNSAIANLWGKSAHIKGTNLVLGNAGLTSLYCNNGGYYTFTHTTIANYWTEGLRSGAALQIDHIQREENSNLYKADFLNCIIDGNNTTELFLNRSDNNLAFNYSFTNCMLKISSNSATNDNPLYDFEDTVYYKAIFLNKNSDFSNPKQNDFSLKATSFAIGRANVEGAALVPKDILNKDRTILPDIGSYQFFLINN